MAEGDTVEKPQRTHDLIERRPGYPDRHQVDLEGADILQLKTIGQSGGRPKYRLNFDTAAR